MRRFLSILKNRWFLAGIGFLCIALIIWLAGPFVAIADHRFLASVIARVIAILLVAVVWLVILLLMQMRNKGRDKALVEQMAAAEAPDPAAGGGKAEIDEERAILKSRFEEAVSVLRKPTEKGKRKTNSLYELPWYIIIGPPGCGKTTALINSGIDFPLADQFGQESVSGIGGTRNCDWWISNEAVLIDTAGRYTTQDSDAGVDSGAWLGFLDLLKKYRRRRPINGAIVAFSLVDLMTFDEETLAIHCRAIRRRLQELSDRLSISIPVYLMFTKADLVAGFIEFFDDLGREERNQVWGTTFPISSDKPDYAAHFKEEFPGLLHRLNARLHWRLISERDLRRRALILGFPQQVASLRQGLDQFIVNVFQGSRFERPVLLRGVYFSSGTQEGTPIDRLMGSIGESLGLERQRLLMPGSQGKSYFITRLLREVVFRERNLAGSDRKAERIRAWTQRAAYAAIVLVSIGCALAWTTSFTENKAFTADLESRLRQYAALREQEISSPTAFDEILPRLDALRSIDEFVGETAVSPPLSMRLGLYQGQGIADSTSDAYQRALNALLVPGLASLLTQELAANAGDSSYRYETLKLYLMLVDPSHLDPDLFRFWATEEWNRGFAGQPRTQARLKAHLDFLLEHGPQPIEPNRQLVKQVRDDLEQTPLANLLYGRLKLTPAVQDARPLTFEDIAGRNGASVFTSTADRTAELQISGLFTYRGFFQLFQTESLKLIAQIKGDAWVYGAEQSPIIADQLDNLEETVLHLYIDEYIQLWETLLAQLDLVSFDNSLAKAVDVSSRLIRPDSPLRKVLATLKDNTNLTRLPKGTEGLAKMATEALRRRNYYLSRIITEAADTGSDATADFPPKRVERHFELLTRIVDPKGDTTSIRQIQRLLIDLFSRLSALEPGSGLSDRPLLEGSGGRQNVYHQLRTEAVRNPEPLRRWLRQLATNAQAIEYGNTGDVINEIWKTRVAPLCKKLLNGRYPFRAGARKEVNLRDFGRIFGEGGVLDTFFGENLEPFVDTASNPWKLRRQARHNLGVSSETLRQFQRARTIREAFFPDGGKKPSIRFSLIPRRIDPRAAEFVLRFGGQLFRFDAARPTPVDGEWPGPTISSHLIMSVTDIDGERYEQERSGQWAFFRAINPKSLRSGTDRFRTSFSVSGFRHRFEVKAFSAVNPFGLSEIAKFKCPDRL